jgi:hypothetical protein
MDGLEKQTEARKEWTSPTVTVINIENTLATGQPTGIEGTNTYS